MLHPAHDYVVIEIENKTANGIVFNQTEHSAGIINAIGPEVENPIYKVGSKVCFDSERAVKYGDFMIIKDEYIVAEVRI